MSDLREQVRAGVAESLPEFLARNGVEVYERSFATRHETGRGRVERSVVENLSWWLTSVVPPRVYRVGCGAVAAGLACACPGTCMTWLPVDPEYLDAEGLAALRKGERVMLANQQFVVVSGPTERGHPVLIPPPEQVFVEPRMDRLFLDRRGRPRG